MRIYIYIDRANITYGFIHILFCPARYAITISFTCDEKYAIKLLGPAAHQVRQAA